MRQVAAYRKVEALAEGTDFTDAEALTAKAACDAAQLDTTAACGLRVSRCPVGDRATFHRRLCTQSAQSGASPTNDQDDEATNVHAGHQKTHDAQAVAGLSSPTVGVTSDSDEESEKDKAAKRREVMARMSSEELLKFSAQLRVDRVSLEDRLGSLSKATDALYNLSSPFFEGSSDQAPGNSVPPSSTPTKIGKRATQNVPQAPKDTENLGGKATLRSHKAHKEIVVTSPGERKGPPRPRPVQRLQSEFCEVNTL